MNNYFTVRIYFHDSFSRNYYSFIEQKDGSTVLDLNRTIDFSNPTYIFSLPSYLSIENALLNIDKYTPESCVDKEYANGDIIVLTKQANVYNSSNPLMTYYSKLIGIFQNKISIKVLEEIHYTIDNSSKFQTIYL